MGKDYLQALADEVTAMIGPRVVLHTDDALVFDTALKVVWYRTALPRVGVVMPGSGYYDHAALVESDKMPVQALACLIVSLLES